MELLGAISGLESVKPSNEVYITMITDSKYVVDGMSKGWAVSWKKRGWKKSDGNAALNPDLWERLLNATGRFGEVKWEWVRGHAGHIYNERCDAEASKKASQFKAKN
ncbi:hypothetical protein FACS1894219_07690 [Clostridia bacterium]|nr:hypothetical protein FACS1894219_07690 [Clostridia bacterium]